MDSETGISILGWYEMRRIADETYDAIYISDPRNPHSKTDAIRIVDEMHQWLGPYVIFDRRVWTWNPHRPGFGIKIRWVGRPDDVYGASVWIDYGEADKVESTRIIGWLDHLWTK